MGGIENVPSATYQAGEEGCLRPQVDGSRFWVLVPSGGDLEELVWVAYGGTPLWGALFCILLRLSCLQVSSLAENNGLLMRTLLKFHTHFAEVP